MRTSRIATVIALVVAASSAASGYYHWVFFANKSGPYTPIRMKFDLNALPGGAVPYFISNQGPDPMVPGDNFTALVSQIRLAAETWNGVPNSALRLEFGGVAEIGQKQSAPGIDVVFDDEMPPGILALSKPSTHTDLSYLAGPDSPGFAPILRSRLQLRKDLTAHQQASYSDRFFLTIVHEFGHAIGLQHSMTSSVMSTEITRATTKPRPLSADDKAGLAVLYPTPEFAATTGSIAGRIQAEDYGGVNLVSVVALSTNGDSIGTMTNPDGTYLIEGLPPGEYRVYAHPLPPSQQGEALPAGIVPPEALDGTAFPAYTRVATLFHPGTRDWREARLVRVEAGLTAERVGIDLLPRPAGPALYNLQTYAYLGEGNGVPVHAPPLASGDRKYLVFAGPGTVIPGAAQLAPELSFSVIGGPARLEPETLAYWTQGFGLVVVNALETERPTPVALAVTTDRDLYVLPAAFSVLPSPHPRITSVTSATDTEGTPVATLSGVNLNEQTRVMFDGVAGSGVRRNEDGTLTVIAPPASGKHQAVVEAMTAGGQTSWQVLGAAEPPKFSYAAPENPAISTVQPGAVVAGTDAAIQIDAVNTRFVPGQTVVGFGSSDIVVRQVWVTSPTQIRLNVAVGLAARRGPVEMTVLSGLQLLTSHVLQVQDGGVISLRAPILNAETGLPGVPAGGRVIIQTAGLPENLAGWTLTIAGERVNYVAGAYGQLTADVPAGLSPGLVPVQIWPASGATVAPVLLQIDAAPPTITGARGPGGHAVDAANPVAAGDRVTLTVTGFVDPPAELGAESVQVRAGGALQAVESVKLVQPGVWEVVFVLSNAGPGPAQNVTVGMGTRVSAPWALAIRGS
jgi:hypothetical protein